MENASPDLAKPSALKALLGRHGIFLSKRFGQNFLADRSHLARVAVTSTVGQGEIALEIGPGAGGLTQELAARAGHVIAIELDRKLIPVLAETVGHLENVTIVSGDALALDWSTLLPEGRPARVAANIPYNITSPLLEKMLHTRPPFLSLTLMVQKEVAKRLRAAPDTPDYGALSVFAQYHATVKIAAIVPAGAFVPPPKIDSAIVHIVPRENPYPDLTADQFLSVSRAAFGQRRKTLGNALGVLAPRDEILAALGRAGIDPIRRGETLNLDEIATIARSLYLTV